MTSGSPPTTVLAFDFGLRSIGVATGQSITRTARELVTLTARDGVPDWNAIDALLHDWQPHVLLVGLPLNMDDSPSAMAERATRFARRLAKRSGIRVEMVDERLTSFEARGMSNDIDRRHAVAARLIAETYLREPPDQRR